MLRRLTLASLIAGVAFLAACESDPTTSTPRRQALADKAAHPGSKHWDADRYRELDRTVPGFAGLYYDSTGTLVIKLRDVRGLNGARAAVQAFMSRGSSNPARLAHARDHASRMRVESAKYEYRLLSAWHMQFIARQLDRKDGVVLSAISHRKNRIVVGVSSSADVAAVKRTIAAMPIPHSAVEVFTISDDGVTSDTSLANGTFSPLMGGVQISHSSTPTQTEQCSLGFNVTRWFNGSPDTSRYFLTASHCTPYAGYVDPNYWMGQPNFSGPGGVEIYDSPAFTTANCPVDYPLCCPSDRTCFWSDATVFKYQVAAKSAGARVAWPELGSLNINGTRRTVTEIVPTMVEGAGVHMIGRTSGHVFGHIVYPCVIYRKPGGVWNMCQVYADYTNNDGDSGAPVVELTGSTTVAAVGIQSAKLRWCNTCAWGSLFSPIDPLINWMYGEAETQHLWLIDPTNLSEANGAQPTPSEVYVWSPIHWATIQGTANAGPGMRCHWYSGTDLNYTNVEWLVGNVLVGSSPDVYYSSASSFDLNVHYWNSTTGDEAWGTISVTVAEGTEQCYDE